MEECCFCRSRTKFHKFPCSHITCERCLLNDIERKLTSFYMILKANPNVFDGKFSFFSCRLNCATSKLSLNYQQVLRIIDNSDKSSTEKDHLRDYLELGMNFFFGVASLFDVCLFCNKIVSFLGFVSIICQECIKKVCLRQMGFTPRFVTIEMSKSQEEYFEILEFFEDEIMIIDFDHESESYKLMFEGNSLSIQLSKRNADYMKVILIKVVIVAEKSHDFVFVGDKREVKMICLAHIYF